MKRLYFGGTILTMDERRTCRAMLVDNGKIAALGDTEDINATGAELYDLRGKTVLPAFIDAHGHFTQVASEMNELSLEGVEQGDIGERVSAFIKERGIRKGEWLTAHGLSDMALSDIDALAPDNPLAVKHISGHAGFFNKQAREMLGLDKANPSEDEFFSALKRMPKPDTDELLSCCKRAQDMYRSYGIATAQDSCVTNEVLPIYERLLESRLLDIDLIAYTDMETYKPLHDMLRSYKAPRIKLGGMKIFLDGSPQARTAWLREPYEGGSERGHSAMSDEEVLTAMEFAAKFEAQLIAHANGDAAIEQFLRCLGIASKKHIGLRYTRPVIVHAQLMGIDQIEKAKALEAIASFFVGHVYYFGDEHIKNLGYKRASEISPLASAKKAGLRFTLHQDAPVTRPDMLETAWCAASRVTKSGASLSESERISVSDALAAMTRDAAYQCFAEDEKGTLTQGKRADIVVLDQNPVSVPLEALRKIRVLETVTAEQRTKPQCD